MLSVRYILLKQTVFNKQKDNVRYRPTLTECIHIHLYLYDNTPTTNALFQTVQCQGVSLLILLFLNTLKVL